MVGRLKKGKAKRSSKLQRTAETAAHVDGKRELVILTGLSGSGKASALKAFEDLGYYAVDNLPVELLPRFAELVAQSSEITRAALVVDVREGQRLERFPALLKELRKQLSRICSANIQLEFCCASSGVLHQAS